MSLLIWEWLYSCEHYPEHGMKLHVACIRTVENYSISGGIWDRV